MKRVALLIGTLVTVACGTDGPENRAAVDTVAGSQTASPTGEEGFILLQGSDTLLVERYSRTGDSLRGELMDVQDDGRLTYNAAVGPEERITRIELAFYPAGAAEPEQSATAEFRGDTLVGETRRGNGDPEQERLATPEGTMMLLANSTAMLEQLIRRARAAGGDPVRIPVLLVAGDGDERQGIEYAEVRQIGSDSVHLVLDQQNQARAAVDAQGRILGAVNPDSDVRIVRMR